MRRFYAPTEAFRSGRVSLDSGETRHLRDVLRLHIGDSVSVFDGEGGEFECAIESISSRSADLKIIGKIEPPAPESPLGLSLAAAVLKGDKFDLVVQKSVELGAMNLIPIISNRSDVKPRDAARRLDRWRKIAIEATKQCGRACLMSIEDIVDLNDFFHSAEKYGRILFFSERAGQGLTESIESEKLCAIIGPEGGWDDSEIEAAKSSKAEIITLSGRVLRAETASIAVAAILQHRFGDLK